MMELAHPWFLLLALVVPWLWFAQRRSLADLTPVQRRVCTALRTLILALLILALAGLRWLLPSRDLAVIFAVDHSASISASAREKARAFIRESLAHQGSRDLAGVVGFAGDAALWQPPVENTRLLDRWPAPAAPNRTDLAHALEFSAAMLPAEKQGRVVLLSDGNDTADRAAAAAQALGSKGIEVFTVPLRNAALPEVLVERVDVPRRLKVGEPFDLHANLRSNVETTAKVKLYQNQFLIEQRDVELKPGDNPFRAANLKADGNFITYEVEVIPAQDTQLENNRAQATASLRGQPRVLIVDSEPDKIRPLADVLRGEKLGVEVRSAAGLPKSLEDLQQFDLLMLSDVSALTLSREQMELYRRWVQDFGGGFMMLGGENSYGVGGYFRTPIEQLLPVRMEHEDREDLPSVALMIVLDRSGSMAAQVQGQTKMSLADQGAVLALNVLQPKDYFGVLAVDVRAHTIAPLAQHNAREPIAQKIMSITAGGGGIYIYTSLVEAFAQIRDLPARIKHIILFSDAADAEEKNGGEMSDGVRGTGSALDFASAMLSAKVTTSVVGLGLETDKDTAFLRQLAERGNGRFYLTNDATSLPQIFTTETTKVAQSSLIEEPFQAVPARLHAILAGLNWVESPLLLGYNATKPKPTAEVLLTTERGEPLLATWRYGLGQAAAFTSDAKSRWAAEWLTWPGYGKFWSQLVRGLMRRTDQASFAVATHEQGDRLTLSIDAVKPDGSFRNQLSISISALGPEGNTQTATATQTAPGAYTAAFDLPLEGTTVFAIASPDLPDGGTTFGHTRSYPREFLSTELNEPLLRRLSDTTHGKYDATPDQVWSPPARATAQRQDLTDAFLIAALTLLPLDIWLRRRSWK
jgi:uncharacterized membrane protein